MVHNTPLMFMALATLVGIPLLMAGGLLLLRDGDQDGKKRRSWTALWLLVIGAALCLPLLIYIEVCFSDWFWN